jgi:hypothetical protein
VVDIHGGRRIQFDKDAGLLVPRYEVKAEVLERPAPEVLSATYRIFTASKEELLRDTKNAFYFDITTIAVFSVAPGMPEDQITNSGDTILDYPRNGEFRVSSGECAETE